MPPHRLVQRTRDKGIPFHIQTVGAEDRLWQAAASFAAAQGLKEITWWEALSDIDDETWTEYGFTPLPLDGKRPFNADGAVTIEVYEEDFIASQTDKRKSSK